MRLPYFTSALSAIAFVLAAVCVIGAVALTRQDDHLLTVIVFLALVALGTVSGVFATLMAVVSRSGFRRLSRR